MQANVQSREDVLCFNLRHARLSVKTMVLGEGTLQAAGEFGFCLGLCLKSVLE